MPFGLGLGLGLSLGGGQVSTAAMALLASETDGVALSAVDMSLLVRDTVTPANAFAGDPNSKLTYSSPSAKYVRGSNGVFASGSTLRREYDAGGAIAGILVEPAATNLVVNSELTGAVAGSPGTAPTGWSYFSGTGTSAPVASTVGPWTALQQSVGTSQRPYIQRTVSVTSGVTYAVSIFVEAFSGTIPWARILSMNGATGTWTFPSTNITGTGRWTATFACTLTVGALFRVGLGVDTGVSSMSLTFSAPQVEVAVDGTLSTSPIITPTSGTVTRNADVITLPSSAFNLSQTQGSLYVKYRPKTTSVEHIAMSIDDGTLNERVSIGNSSGAASLIRVVDGGADQTAPLTSGAVTTTAFATIAASWAANDIAMSADGAAVVTDATATLPTVTTLRVGGSFGTQLHGHIQEFVYLPRAWSDAELPAAP